ncbi:TPR repeat-containing protein ZIP4 [Linum perenne]
MRIAEICSQDLPEPNLDSPPPDNNHQLLLSRVESLVRRTENISASHATHKTGIPDDLSADFRKTLTHFRQIFPLPNSIKLQIWKLSYRLWNACVDISNSLTIRLSPSSSMETQAKLRHVAADMLHLAGDVQGVPSPAIKCASFYQKTGVIWHDLGNLDLASSCLETATEIVAKVDVNKVFDPCEKKLLLEVNLARSRVSWQVSDRNLAVMLLNRAKSLLFGSPDNLKLLANQYLAFGKAALSLKDGNALNEALKLMNEALDLCEKGSGAARTREQASQLQEMKVKALRFISAVHLQKSEFESVIKCVKVLREGGGDKADHHASLPVLAMKAWLGLGRYEEAEKELRGMVTNKGVPEAVWVSAIETYFEAAGTAGAETAKAVFMGLLGRCNVSANAAVRLAHRVIGDSVGGEGSRVRAQVVLELVSDDRVVALFTSQKAAKESAAMHAILWNCASDHFRTKEYKMSAEMFEKSLLYVPHEIDRRMFRAKGFRVLCLCYLGLSQLDRAQEYITEAEKVCDNVYKWLMQLKVLLQKNDEKGAMDQIQTIRSCLDFTPDFLSLAAHEAIASRALRVAASSLSNLLDCYTTGMPMPTTEVIVLRSLITILSQEPGNEEQVLKYMNWGNSRASKLGTECFYGKNEVGGREQNWFAVTCWNLGTRCGKVKKYEMCAEFLRLTTQICGSSSDGQVENSWTMMVCKALILTVSAVIASKNHKQTALSNADVKEAVELLDRAGKMLGVISGGTQFDADKVREMEEEILFMYTFNAYQIHGMLDDDGGQQRQLELVKAFAQSKVCNPRDLFQIGVAASEGPCSNPEVAIFALKESLSTFQSLLSPDYAEIAVIVRRLIMVMSVEKSDLGDEDVVHSMYKQAYRIMVGLKEGEYPTEEGKWLATTAWNRAVVPVKLGQIDVANKWMTVGLELATKVPGMETYRTCMEDFVSDFLKKFPLRNNGLVR